MLLSDDELKRMPSDDRRVYENSSPEVKQAMADRLRSAFAEGTEHGSADYVGGSTSASDTRFVGPALIVGGLALVVWGFMFDPSVESSGGGLYGLSDRIVNIGRVADKMMIFTGGFGMAILGSIMTATNQILKAIRDRG